MVIHIMELLSYNLTKQEATYLLENLMSDYTSTYLKIKEHVTGIRLDDSYYMQYTLSEIRNRFKEMSLMDAVQLLTYMEHYQTEFITALNSYIN